MSPEVLGVGTPYGMTPRFGDSPSGRRPQLMAVQPARILSLLFPLCQGQDVI